VLQAERGGRDAQHPGGSWQPSRATAASTRFFRLLLWQHSLFWPPPRGSIVLFLPFVMCSPATRGPNAPRPGGGAGASASKVLPVDVPAISLAELNRLTFNFGERALVGEGSYGRVYRATLSTGEAVAVKRFDNGSASGQSEAEFCEQLSVASRLKCEHFTQLLSYCLELNNRIVVYQFAAMGSLYDIHHGKSVHALSFARLMNCLNNKICAMSRPLRD
jgi:hypothetical protein